MLVRVISTFPRRFFYVVKRRDQDLESKKFISVPIAMLFRTPPKLNPPPLDRNMFLL